MDISKLTVEDKLEVLAEFGSIWEKTCASSLCDSHCPCWKSCGTDFEISLQNRDVNRGIYEAFARNLHVGDEIKISKNFKIFPNASDTAVENLTVEQALLWCVNADLPNDATVKIEKIIPFPTGDQYVVSASSPFQGEFRHFYIAGFID